VSKLVAVLFGITCRGVNHAVYFVLRVVMLPKIFILIHMTDRNLI